LFIVYKVFVFVVHFLYLYTTNLHARRIYSYISILNTDHQNPDIIMVSFTALALLATSAMAGPVARQIAIPENWNWQVENWGAGCARSGCYYSFNITVPTIEGQIAGVKAYCNGYEHGYDNSFTIPSPYETCELLGGVNNGVAARFSLREDDGQGLGPKDIEVSFLYAGYEDR
jgi:hypothetical protein